MSGIRYSFGADEHISAEIGEEMSLEAFFKGMAICKELEKRRIAGVTEICPSNASYLVRFDPDVIQPRQDDGHAQGDRGASWRCRSRIGHADCRVAGAL